MRRANDHSQFTPFGLWIQEYIRCSNDGMSVTNLDYVLEDFRQRKVLLLEEKQNNSDLKQAQSMTFKELDRFIAWAAEQHGYDYWGFYELKIPGTFIGPGIQLNGVKITVEQLQKHLNFERRVVDPYQF